MKFSQRIGKTPIRQAIQVESIDNVLENRLWNNILADLIMKTEAYTLSVGDSDRAKILKMIWREFFENRIDEIPSYQSGGVDVDTVQEYIKNWFISAAWYEKYDFIEFLVFLDQKTINTGFATKCNNTLKRESAGYRIIEQKIVQITSEEEIAEIEEAINSSSKLKPVETHLITALELLSKREKPDYRNSIKESISAIESLCIIITGEKTTTLGKALGQIEDKYKIHGALKSAFSSLYGYTSDSGGIRHSLLEGDSEVTMEDAKFMLIVCSAFINYLKTKM